MINKIKRVYFIFVTPVLSSYTDRYAINYLQNLGWKTYILDLSAIVNPDAHKAVKTGLVNDKHVERFFLKKNFNNYMKKIHENSFIVMTVDFYLDSYFVHRAIKNNCKLVYMNRIDTNLEIKGMDKKKRLLDMVLSFSCKRLMNSLFIRIPRKWLPVKAADLIILGGRMNREQYLNLCYHDDSALVSHIHTLDYDRYLKIKEDSISLVDAPYCVFIDAFLPYHPDNAEKNIYHNPGSYYDDLKRFFNHIETKYGIKVVVASHPRADLSIQKKVYAGFDVLRYKTGELIKNCEFVISHFSISTCYAALFNKPVVFTTTDSIVNDRDWNDIVMSYSMLFGSEIVNISLLDNLEKFQIPMTINKKLYHEFIVNYLKANYSENDKDVYFEQKFAELLESL